MLNNSIVASSAVSKCVLALGTEGVDSDSYYDRCYIAAHHGATHVCVQHTVHAALEAMLEHDEFHLASSRTMSVRSSIN